MKSLVLFLLCLSLTTPVWAEASRSFDGTNDRLDIGGGGSFNVTTGNMSVCIWLEVTATAGAQAWIGKKNGLSAEAGYKLGNDSAETAGFWVADGTDRNDQGFGTSIVTGWHHLCGSWEGGTQENIIYVDGALNDSGINTSVGSLTNDTVNFTIGEEEDGGGDATGIASYGWACGVLITPIYVLEQMWNPEVGMLSGTCSQSSMSLWPVWGSNSPEIDLGGAGTTRDLAVTGTAASASGPPVAFGGMLPL